MKIAKIITTIAALNLILFMSVSSIANPFTANTGDIVKKSVKNKIEVVTGNLVKIASPVSSENEFSHLRFDISKFDTEKRSEELPLISLEYLRFDANIYSVGINSEITELPSMNEFEYLHFDATDFYNASGLDEMPVNEFDYLRFDVNRFSVENSISMD